MATKKKTTTKAKTKTSTTKRTKTAPKKRTASRPAASNKKRAAKDEEVTIDRRRKARREEDAGKESDVEPKIERRKKVQRRRQIDPTTCERDYSECEVEFMNAMDEYKRTSGRMFPTCSEVLEVIRALGYVKLTSAELTALGRSPVTESSVQADNEESAIDEEELEASTF